MFPIEAFRGTVERFIGILISLGIRHHLTGVVSVAWGECRELVVKLYGIAFPRNSADRQAVVSRFSFGCPDQLHSGNAPGRLYGAQSYARAVHSEGAGVFRDGNASGSGWPAVVPAAFSVRFVR